MTALLVSKIKIDGGTQSRAQLNESVVAEYAEAIMAGAKLPPVVVFFDGSAHFLADGFHRFHAHLKAANDTIAADIRTGTKRDAILYSVGANSDHGLRRTNDDKRRSVETLTADKEWGAWSDREIAKACGVSVPFVGAIRRPEVKEKQQANREKSAVEKSAKKPGCNPITPAAPLPKILPRRDDPKEAPPVVDPMDKAREFAKKQNAKLRALSAQLAERDATIEALNAELHEARHIARELAHDLESFQTASDGVVAAAKELSTLKALLRTVEGTRDQWMTTCSELRKEVKALQRKLGLRQ